MRGMWGFMELEATRNEKFLIFVCIVSMLIITLFFFVETINQQEHANNLIKACNVSRNAIADEYDFNLIEYDQRQKQKIDFNVVAGVLNN